MQQYDITFKVTGFYTVSVKAESLEEAQEKAEQTICEIDFGNLENIDSEMYD